MQLPNIIIIVLDTVRGQNVSCYGHDRNTTPHLDDYFSKWNLFKNAFAPAIWTIPSHASLFTGTYPSKHGALNLHRFLDDKQITMASSLSSHGYDTVSFSNNYFLSLDEFGLARGFMQIQGLNFPKNKLTKYFYQGKQKFFHSADSGAYLTNQFARRFIKERESLQKPFLLFLNYMEAHAPYIRIPRKYFNTFLTSSERKRFRHINQDRQKYLTRTVEVSQDDFYILRAVYDAQIAYIDAMIHNLMKNLKKSRVWDNSIIIITSDHGDLIGEHGLMHHSYAVYDELIKIPLAVKLPGNRDNDREYDHMVSLVDIFPTIADILGINNGEFMKQFQGYKLFNGSNSGDRDYVFIECERPKNEFVETYPDFDFSVYDHQLLAIRSRKYKYIWKSDNAHELYDMESDPAEQVNLINVRSDQAELMRNKLFQWYNSFDKWQGDKTDSEEELDSEVKEHLKSLGYF